MKILTIVAALLCLLVRVASAQQFESYVSGSSALSLPALSSDAVPVVRGGTTYKLSPLDFLYFPARSASSAAIGSTDGGAGVLNTSGGMTIANAVTPLGDGFATSFLTAAAATLTPTTATINGNATLPLGIYQGASLFSLGGQYYAILGMPEVVASSVLCGTSGRVATWTAGTSSQYLRGDCSLNQSAAFTSGTLSDITGFGLRDTSAAHDLTIGATSSVALTADRALTFDVVNAARTVKLGSNLTIASDLGTVTGALTSNGSGTFAQAACSNLSNGATGCSTATGTSGATIPLLNGTNTWSGVQSFNDGDFSLKGSSSGTLVQHAAAAASSSVLTWPAGTTDFSATGGTSQFVKQASSGAALTVARPACADLSDGATGCSTATGTSGATIPLLNGTNTWSGNQTISSASLSLSGNISAAAWTTNGLRYANASATLTDTTSSGTVAAAYSSLFGGNTIAASSSTTFTNYYGAYFKDPTAGSNITLTNKYSLGADSANVTTLYQNGTKVNAIVPLTNSTGGSLTGPSQFYVCTTTCTVTPPVPVAGYQFCVMNGDNVTTVITLAALGSSARYENTARTAYGTAGTGTFVSNGAAANSVCILGLDSTHYLTTTYVGTWTAN